MRTRRALRPALLALACLGACATLAERTSDPEHAPAAPALIPAPLALTWSEGAFPIDAGTPLVLEDARLFDFELDQRLLEALDPDGALGLACTASAPAGPSVRLALVPAATGGHGPEGYRLTVSADGVRIEAATEVGVLYGIQSLAQLLPTEAGAAQLLPLVELVDRPRFGWRGQLLDVSRHFLPLEQVKRNIDQLAALKMNVFHWHLTDDQGWRFESQHFPLLTRVGAWRVDRNDEPWWGRAEARPGEVATYGGFYTQAELRGVVEYARLRGVRVLPEIDVPGHGRSLIAAYPELSCDGVRRAVATGGIADENTLCPGKDETFHFLEALLEEVIDVFPFEYLHIGGDECNKRAWSQCSDCRARMDAEGLADVEELQSYFVRRVEGILAERGRRLLGWDEILEGGLAPGAAVMSWRGLEGGIVAANAGHEVVMTPSSFCYLDLKQGDPELEPELGYSTLLLSTAYAFDPLPADLAPGREGLILGLQGNLWGESIQNEQHAEYMLYPRLFAIAEVAWSARQQRDWPGFLARLGRALERLERRGIAWAPSLFNVAVDSELVDGGVRVRLTTEAGCVPIRYTTDGSAPTATSALYHEPLVIERSTTLRAAAFRDAERFRGLPAYEPASFERPTSGGASDAPDGELPIGRVTTRQVVLHAAMGAAVELGAQPSSRYAGGGAAGLVDGRRASADHLDPRWIGLEGQDFEATVDLGTPRSLERIGLSCLEQQKSWIFFPTEMEVFVSDDGVQFESLGKLDRATKRSFAEFERQVFELDGLEVRASHVRVRAKSVGRCPEWHRGAGGAAWLFIDELEIE